MFRALLAGAALSLAASHANAQITTYIAPPRPAASSPLMVAAADSARKDSVAQVTMTNMKTWVDSAAGVAVPTYVGDTSAGNDPGRPSPPITTTFADGSVAPATASDLPAIAVFGVLVLAAGIALLARRQRS